MVYFLIPVYNEVLNLPLLAENLRSSLPGERKKFVFVDDGSSDGFPEAIKKLFQDTDHIVLGDGSNHGPGYSFNLGFDWILSDSGDPSDRVVTMEADNTSDIELLPVMMTIAGMNYDLVLASVYAQGGGFEKTSFFRRLLSGIANLFFRFTFDVKVLTLSSFYRVYTVSLLRSIRKEYGILIREAGFICKLEILLKAIRCQAKVIEVPMKLHSSKRQGKSKMKIMRTSITYLRFLVQNMFNEGRKKN
jgi:dolichol-phosphate mannosyltransferase